MISINNILFYSFGGIMSVSILKNIYNNWNRNTIIKELEINNQDNKNSSKNYFMIDLIDTDCDGNVLFFVNDILGHKGIQCGKNGEIKYLKSFKNYNNTIVYEFDDDYKLILSSSNKDNFIYSFQTKDKVIVKSISY